MGVVQNAPDIFQTVSDLLAEIGWQCMGFRVRSLQTRDVQGVPSQASRTVARVRGDEFRAYRSVAGLRRRRKEQQGSCKQAANQFFHRSKPLFLDRRIPFSGAVYLRSVGVLVCVCPRERSDL